MEIQKQDVLAMSRQVDKRKTKQVRIDAGWHRELKVQAALQGTTIRDLIEGCLAEFFTPSKE